MTGFSARDLAGGPLEDRFHGFFLDRYPLFAFALAYGCTAVAAAAARPGRPLLRRAVGGALGIVLVLALGLHPTFGGLVLRAGFATGGMSFLTGQASAAANALGAAASALVFGAGLGLGALLAAGPRPAAGGRRRRALVRLGRGFAALLALWWAMGVLALGREAGIAGWPRAPLDGREAAIALLLVAAAFLPHALLRAWPGATESGSVPQVDPARARDYACPVPTARATIRRRCGRGAR